MVASIKITQFRPAAAGKSQYFLAVTHALLNSNLFWLFHAYNFLFLQIVIEVLKYRAWIESIVFSSLLF